MQTRLSEPSHPKVFSYCHSLGDPMLSVGTASVKQSSCLNQQTPCSRAALTPGVPPWGRPWLTVFSDRKDPIYKRGDIEWPAIFRWRVCEPRPRVPPVGLTNGRAIVGACVLLKVSIGLRFPMVTTRQWTRGAR